MRRQSPPLRHYSRKEAKRINCTSGAVASPTSRKLDDTNIWHRIPSARTEKTPRVQAKNSIMTNGIQSWWMCVCDFHLPSCNSPLRIQVCFSVVWFGISRHCRFYLLINFSNHILWWVPSICISFHAKSSGLLALDLWVSDDAHAKNGRFSSAVAYSW